MLLKNLVTKELIEAVIELMIERDFETIQNEKDRFDKFDWNLHRGGEVYKLCLKNDIRILGLICLIDHADPAINAIEIALLEVSRENIGINKAFENIAGCLIGFACRESFKRGHDGFVFLLPKTELITHYHDRYGFTYLPIKTVERPEGLMILNAMASRRLVVKYLE